MHFYTDVIIKHYADFNGRATRKQYWMFFLFNFLIMFLSLIIIEILNREILYLLFVLYNLFILLPSLALQVRRLHDIGQSGWMFLLSFIPFAGGIILFVFACLDSEAHVNKYGPNPKGVVSRETPTDSPQANVDRTDEATPNVDTTDEVTPNVDRTDEVTPNVDTTEAVRSKRFCANCGKESTTGTYCVNCGNKL